MWRLNRNTIPGKFLKGVDTLHKNKTVTGEKQSAVWSRSISRSPSASSTEPRTSSTSPEPLTSATSSEARTFGSDVYSDFEFSNESRSSTSSMRDESSHSFNRKDSMSVSEYETTSDTESSLVETSNQGRLRVSKKTSDTGRLRSSKNDSAGIEVVGHGTKLMTTILFPTVIIKMHKRRLRSSMLYYVVLKSMSGPYREEIPCVMLSSPDNSEMGELLPLRAVRSKTGALELIPMLMDRRARSIFAEGCTFKVNAVKRGRRLDRKARQWKNYDLEKWEIHCLLRSLLYLDISQMPAGMVPPLPAARHVAVQVSKSRTAVKQKRSLRSPVKEKYSLRSPHKKSSPVVFPTTKLSSLQPDLRIRGITASGGSSFARWFNVLSPNIHVDKEFTCDHGTKLRRDNFASMAALEKYLCISDAI